MEAADSSETSVYLYQTAKVQRSNAVLTWTVNRNSVQNYTIADWHKVDTDMSKGRVCPMDLG